MRLAVILISAATLVGCRDKSAVEDALHSVLVTLPNGQEIQAQPMVETSDLLRGMQFRRTLEPDHGMLYFQRPPGKYGYWMYQTLIPLDMIWIDADHKIVEIVENTPPCKTVASQCPMYGGHEIAKFVLQLGGGLAKKYGLKLGQQIQF
jgi:uncharacterized membrane protein (UPF0127 family)